MPDILQYQRLMITVVEAELLFGAQHMVLMYTEIMDSNYIFRQLMDNAFSGYTMTKLLQLYHRDNLYTAIKLISMVRHWLCNTNDCNFRHAYSYICATVCKQSKKSSKF